MTDPGLRLIVNPCQHHRHGGEDPRICQDCGVALDIPTYEPSPRLPEWRRRSLESASHPFLAVHEVPK